MEEQQRKRLGLRLEMGLHGRLVQLARLRRRSLNQEVQVALAYWLAHQPEVGEQAERRLEARVARAFEVPREGPLEYIDSAVRQEQREDGS